MKSTEDPLPQKSPPPACLSWSIWVLGALLYLFGFYQRVAPAVMATELMNDFNIGAAALMFGWIVLAFVLLFFSRETNCRQVVTHSNTKKAASR
ncbi:MAG: hypothetical protein WAM73_06610 [Desulfobacterales bacterium]